MTKFQTISFWMKRAIERIHSNSVWRLCRNAEDEGAQTTTTMILWHSHTFIWKRLLQRFLSTRTSLIFFLARNVNPCAKFFFTFIAGVVFNFIYFSTELNEEKTIIKYYSQQIGKYCIQKWIKKSFCCFNWTYSFERVKKKVWNKMTQLVPILEKTVSPGKRPSWFFSSISVFFFSIDAILLY